MIVRCWNCGNDHEVSEDSIRKDERDRIIAVLTKDANIAGTIGDTYSHNALMRAVGDIQHG